MSGTQECLHCIIVVIVMFCLCLFVSNIHSGGGGGGETNVLRNSGETLICHM